jgi:hypothetical protein
MTPAEQKRFDRLATAIRRIYSYQTPRQLQREAERSYGLEYTEALEYAYENMRNEAKAVEALVRPKKAKVNTLPDPPTPMVSPEDR